MTSARGNRGSYEFKKLAAGTYTVTPSKAGCTFSPPSSSTFVSGNATLNFMASCP